jgi:hypothetical protein
LRKFTNERGLEIIRQGAQQFMACGYEDSRGTPNCPFDPIKQAVENKLWMKGYLEARFKWFKPILARKNFAAKKFAKPFQKSKMFK